MGSEEKAVIFGAMLRRCGVGRGLLLLAAAGCALLLSTPADAANYPCSGRKGGVSHCQGDIFVCNDGSVSGSKKSCQAQLGGVQRLMPKGAFSKGAGQCQCREGKYCVGPRGGRYCTTDSGGKSYLRR